jgi:hypothetical protein
VSKARKFNRKIAGLLYGSWNMKKRVCNRSGGAVREVESGMSPSNMDEGLKRGDLFTAWCYRKDITSSVQFPVPEPAGGWKPDSIKGIVAFETVWTPIPDYTTDLTAAYPLFLDMLAAHCDPALVAGLKPGTVECNTVDPKLSNRAPAAQPALAIALTWCEWKESL